MKHLSLFTFAVILFCIGNFQTAFCQVWDTLGSGLTAQGALYRGLALNVYNDALYAGGKFSAAGGLNNTAGVAAWKGTNWSPLGGGNVPINPSISDNAIGGVQAMAVYNNELYTAGDFSSSDMPQIRNIARWNGTNWDTVVGQTTWDTGYDAVSITALAVYNGELYAGGNLYEMVRLGGTNWNYVTVNHGGMGITAMSVYNGELYVAGNANFNPFNLPPNGNYIYPDPPYSGRCIFKWNGTNWDTLPPLNVQQVFGKGIATLYVYNGELYVGGGYYVIGSDTTSIAKWNGSQWSAVGPKADDHDVMSFCAYNNELYVGGGFYSFQGHPSPAIAKWNGTSFDSVATQRLQNDNLDAFVYAMAVYNNELYITGQFISAIGYSSSNTTIAVNGIAKLAGNCAAPIASFTSMVNDTVLTLTNTSTNATSWFWSFGNGDTSTSQNPPPQHYDSGTYQIKLTAYNYCAGLSYDSNVVVQTTVLGGDSSDEEAVTSINLANKISLSPIPANNEITVSSDLFVQGNYTIQVKDISGRNITPEMTKQNGPSVIDVSALNDGLYFVVINTPQGQCTKKVIIAR